MLSACLDEVWSANPGESIIFSWIEKARAFLDEHFCDCEEESETKVEENNIAPPVTKCPEILTSSHVIEDRRSVFQVLTYTFFSTVSYTIIDDIVAF